MIKKIKVRNTAYRLPGWMIKIPKKMNQAMFGQYLVEALSIALNSLHGINQNGLINKEPISKAVAKESLEKIERLGS